jgi:predicted permease
MSLGLAVLAGSAFSAFPALLALRRGASAVPAAASRTATGTRADRAVRTALITGQVALALVLLGAASVLVRSFVKLTSQPIGFAPDHVLTAEVALPRKSYPHADARRDLLLSLVRDLAQQPGIRSAAATTALPFTWWEWMTDFSVPGDGPVKTVNTAYRIVSPGYFETLQVPLKQGRLLEGTDTTAAPFVAVVNEAFARTHAALGSVIGARLRKNDEPDSPPIAIVGIVGDTRHRSFERPAQAELYLPLGQHAPAFMTLAVRTWGPSLGAAPTLQASLRALDPTLPLNEIRTLDAWVAAAVAEPRFYLALAGSFAALAVLLAVVGTYGVMAYVMRLRTREIGIRLALGATAPGVAGLVVRQGLLPVVAGVAIGLATVLAGAGALQDQLFQTGPRDPMAMASAIALLFGTAAIACWIPARRTARVDPAIVLREE